MHLPVTTLAPSSEISPLGIMHLKRYWQKSLIVREGKLPADIQHEEWMTDNTLLSALGLSLHQTLSFLYHTHPSLDELENWVIETAGIPSPEKTEAFNRFVLEGECPVPRNENDDAVLTDADLAQWERDGYVILRNAVLPEDCTAAIVAICEHLHINLGDAGTWYTNRSGLSGIMVHLFQHPALQKVRSQPKIRTAFEQLWGRKDIWLKIDSAGFNPPQTDQWQYAGHGLHWDVSLQLPIPFSTQGILYLSDTAENQGAFSLVPGFHQSIADWLQQLPEGTDPRKADLESLGVRRIAANAGDMIIWQQALPHGSSPNTSNRPRFVQYINYLPAQRQIHEAWK